MLTESASRFNAIKTLRLSKPENDVSGKAAKPSMIMDQGVFISKTLIIDNSNNKPPNDEEFVNSKNVTLLVDARKTAYKFE